MSLVMERALTEAETCPVCFEAGEFITLACSHSLCKPCAAVADASGHSTCPICRADHILDPKSLAEKASSWRAEYSSWRSGGLKGSKGELTAIVAPTCEMKKEQSDFIPSVGDLAIASRSTETESPKTIVHKEVGKEDTALDGPPRLGVAIVGMGRAGKIHLGVLRARADVNVKWLVDVQPEACPSVKGTKITADLDAALADGEVDAVLVSTPTPQHAHVIRSALKAGKHVFAEKPLCCDAADAPALFELATTHERLLFTAFNRRHDPYILAAKARLESGEMGRVFGATLVSRDYPYPTAAYLRVSGNLFKDCVVHDLDYLTWLLGEEPVSLRARADMGSHPRAAGMYEFSEVILTLKSGVSATLINARQSDSYDHRLDIFCENGVLRVSNPSDGSGISFAQRFEKSYHAQLDAFIGAVRTASEGGAAQPNLSAERTALLDRLVAACERSAAANGESIDLTRAVDAGLRLYDERTAGRVREAYRSMRSQQSVEHVRRLRAKYGGPTLGKIRMSIWAAMQQLESFVDVSDPDLTLPNLVHAFQTAESIRAAGLPDWLQLTGLIHDCGKMVYLRGCDADGTSVAQQWSIVGDTWIVGCQMSDQLIFPAFNAMSPDAQHPERMTELGIYTEGCGLDATLTAYGHDEYMYEVLTHNEGVLLPAEALYVIRYRATTAFEPAALSLY